MKPPKIGNRLSEIKMTDKDVKEAIDDMAITSAPGPGGITAILKKKCAEELILTIKKIWQASLENGKLAEGTAKAIIAPICKGGVKINPANYRPVA